MTYEIKGSPLPVVECTLSNGERMICESGAMSWMTPNLDMETTGGGLGKMFSNALAGENMFQNIYTARGEARIAFASSFPGNIMAVEIGPGRVWLQTLPALQVASVIGRYIPAQSAGK